MTERETPEVLEVEVERLPERGSSSARGSARTSEALPRTLSPIVAGLIVDGLDAVTLGPWGLPLGLLLGAPAGYHLARRSGLTRRGASWAALATAVYCAVPFTSPLPVATAIAVVGALWGALRGDARE